MLIFTENILGSSLAKGTSTMFLINPSIGIVLTFINIFLLTSIAILIKNEYITKLKLRYAKLRVWVNFITIL